MLRSLTFLSTCAALVVGADLQVSEKTEFHVKQKSTLGTFVRKDIVKQQRAPASMRHEIVFGIKQNNMDLLAEKLHDVSDPASANYGKHMTRKEVRALTANKEATDAVIEFLQANGVDIVKQTKAGEYITCRAPISTWETLLNTEFYSYLQTDVNSVVVRAEEYSLPAQVSDHIAVAFRTTWIPDRLHYKQSISRRRSAIRGKTRSNSAAQPQANPYPGYVTPQLLTEYYDIFTNEGNAQATTCVFESLNQSYSPSDLSSFQNTFDLPTVDVATLIPNNYQHAYDSACDWNNGNDCTEANLDVQYLLAVAPYCPLTYYYWDDETNDDFWLAWVTDLVDMDDPPLVSSISYSSYEASYDSSYANSFNTEAIKLGNMGGTLLSASGDDGVAGYLARDDSGYCGYYPQFPASSPYVTAVGGTMGPESNDPEVPCVSDNNGGITTGGGFSTLYNVPSWQSDVVAAYKSTVMGTANQPVSGYDTNGRGYPDVSLLAHDYVVTLAGGNYGVDGTSASTPVFAGFVALVNAHRISIGESPLGWLNPALYAYADQIVQVDPNTLENNCCADEGSATVCCNQGFHAVDGWDPLTGIGSINFTAFSYVFTNGSLTDIADDDSSAAGFVARSAASVCTLLLILVASVLAV